MTLRPLALAVAYSFGGLLVAGCSTTVTVDRAELEQQVAAELTSNGAPSDGEVSCPGDLDGTVGTTMTCEASTPEDGTGGARVEVEVIEVDGSDVGFDFEVVPLISPEYVEDQVTTQLTESVGQTPDDVTCPDELDGAVEATTTCVLTAGGDTIDVAVTVSELDGTDVTLDIQVADAVN